MGTHDREEIRRRAALSWDMDLEDLERELGVVDPVNTLPVTEVDERVPPQGSVLWDRIEYLPKDD